MTERVAVPQAVLAKLRLICLGLPDVEEEQAWVGTRWNVRKKNFAHVLMIDDGWPQAYAKASGRSATTCVLTFRLPGAKADAERFKRDPFFKPVWFHNIVGMVIDERIDWEEVESFLTESYCVLAPKQLVARVDRPRR